MEIKRSENVVIVKTTNGSYVTSDKVSDVLLYEILQVLKGGLTPLAPDGAVCPAHQTYFEADGTCAIVGCEYTRPAGKA